VNKQFGDEFPEGEDVEDNAKSAIKSTVSPVVVTGNSA